MKYCKNYLKTPSPVMKTSINNLGLKAVRHKLHESTRKLTEIHLPILLLHPKKNISCKQTMNTNVKIDVKLTLWWQPGYKGL